MDIHLRDSSSKYQTLISLFCTHQNCIMDNHVMLLWPLEYFIGTNIGYSSNVREKGGSTSLTILFSNHLSLTSDLWRNKTNQKKTKLLTISVKPHQTYQVNGNCSAHVWCFFLPARLFAKPNWPVIRILMKSSPAFCQGKGSKPFSETWALWKINLLENTAFSQNKNIQVNMVVTQCRCLLSNVIWMQCNT